MSKGISGFLRIHPMIYVIAAAALISIGVTGSKVYAWYVDSIQNRDNLITTSAKSAVLLSTDMPLSNAKPYPDTVADLLIDGNGLVSISDNDDTSRKFLELNGENSISGVVPGFKFTRPIIVTNETNSDISYSVEFICTDVNDTPLSGSMYLNYTQLGNDIDNTELTEDSGLSIPRSSLTENIAINSVRIGDPTMIKLPAEKSHIYMIELGLLSTAGNASKGAGMWLDIMLFSTQNDNTVHSVYDQASLKKAIHDNAIGDTIMLIKDITVDTQIISDNVFNLDLNGFTLNIKEQGELIVNFPDELASMEIGSDMGGSIVAASQDAIKLNGIENKSSLVWHTGVAHFDSIVFSRNVHIINTHSQEDSGGSSSRPVVSDITSSDTSSDTSDISSDKGESSSDTSSDTSDASSDKGEASSDTSSEEVSSGDDERYQDFSSIMEKSYSRDETGTLSNPYTINSIEQFKCFIYDDSADLTKWYRITADISYIKGIPYELITKKKTRVIINDNAVISNLKIKKSSSEDVEVSNPLKGCTIFSEDGVTVSGDMYISEISYY